MSRPRLTVLGGGREIGAHAFLLDLDGVRLLFDAGTHPRRTGFPSLPDLSPLADVDAILVTHAHLDHVGALPVIARRCPRARIYWSRSTEMAAVRQLRASTAVMRREIEEGIAGAALLFDRDMIDELAWKSFLLEPGGSADLGHGVTVSAFHAGHLLGSTGFVVRGPSASVTYTGDVCLHERELQPGLALPGGDTDVLIVEGTYGADPVEHGSLYEAEVERFAGDATRVLDRGGSVLIPSFALGRTQEMVALIRRLTGQGRIPHAPLYVSGLGRAMSEIHDSRRKDPWRKPARWRLATAAEVFEASHLDRLERLLARPSLLALTSGMMIESTMSALVAERLVGDPRHAVFFVGYLDPEEPGRRLLECRPGDWMEFRRGRPMTRVETADIARYRFSAHADRRQILELCDRMRPRHVVLVHGDPPALEWLAGRLADGRRVSRPETGATLEL